MNVYKTHPAPYRKRRFPVSGMATSSTVGGEVPTPLLTASGKKLELPLPSAGCWEGGGVGRQ